MYETLAENWQPKSPEDKTNWGEALIHLGLAYNWLNKYEQGIECQLRANQIFCEVVDPSGEAKSSSVSKKLQKLSRKNFPF